ncbi:MAG: APC family permease, partial [Ignavibacteria bacterium]|nr:APC family permease [Ignavibacteria bacterium]
YNIIILGVLTLIGSMVLSYQGAAELLNFGAFLAFMGVNLATLRQFLFHRPTREKPNIMLDAVVPFLGFLVCFIIWISLPTPSKIIGGIWLIIGSLYLFIKTHGFKQKPIMIDFKEM